MQSLVHSSFLQALGYAIANSLWQMALVWIIYSLFTITFKLNAAAKYRFAVTAQLMGFTWFLVTLQFYYERYSDAFRANAALSNTSTVTMIIPEGGNSFQSLLLGWIVKAEQLLPFLSTAYLVLLVLLSVKWISNYHHSQYIRSRGLQKPSMQWKVFVKNVAVQLGIKKEIKVYVSEAIHSPLTVGFIKPVILIPIASINYLSVEQLEAVLLHELAHIKRHDYLLNLVMSVVETALFFNPFTQLISRSIKRERENSCDDWVLQFQYNPSMYAEALLRIALQSKEMLRKQAAPALSMAAAKKNGYLLSRVRRMINGNEQRFNYRTQLLSLLLITGVFCSLAWLHPSVSPKNNTASAKKIQPVMIEPMAAKVDNPLFNPVFFLQKPFHKEMEHNMQQATKSMNLEAAKELLKHTTDEIETKFSPVAIKEIENIDIEKIQKEIERSLQETAIKDIRLPKINLDTTLIKTSLKQAFGENFPAQWALAAEDTRKAKAQMEKLMKDKNLAILDQRKWKAEMNHALANMKVSYSPFLKAMSAFGNQSNQQESGEKKLERARLFVNRDANVRTRAAQLQMDSLQRNLLKLSRMAPMADASENEEESASTSSPTLFVPAVFSSNDNEFSLSYPYNPNLYIQSTKPKAVQKITSVPATVNSSRTEKRIEIIIEGKEKNKVQIVIEIN